MEGEHCVYPLTLTCSSCGMRSRVAAGWVIRDARTGKVALCSLCALIAREEMARQSRDVDWVHTLLYGVLAAVTGAALWYSLVLLTDYKLGILAIGLGWMVGRSMANGAGCKRNFSLEMASALVAFAAIVIGHSLVVNHILNHRTIASEIWIALPQVARGYWHALAGGNEFVNLASYLVAIYLAALQLRPARLLT